MEKANTFIEFSNAELMLKELFNSSNEIHMSSAEIKILKRLEKNRFGTKSKVKNLLIYILFSLISLALVLYLPLNELFIKASFSSLTMVVTFYFSAISFLFLLIFPEIIVRKIRFKWMKIVTIIQFVLFVVSIFYLSFSKQFECFTFYHLLAFAAFMLIPFVISEKFLKDTPYSFLNYVLLSANTFMLFGSLFTSIFQYLRLAHPDYVGGKLQGIMWIAFGVLVALYFTGFGIFKLTCYIKEKRGKLSI